MFSSSTSRRSTVPEATKPQAAAPNFVLSLLAACSSSVPTTGKEGEATLSEQILGLLQDKPLGVGEFNLIYSYRFGFSIENALKFIGFDGKLEDFAIQQKCFSIHDGRISLTPVVVAIHKEPPAIDEPAAPEDCPKDENEEAPPSRVCHLDDVDVPAWHGVGSRLVKVLGSPEQDCCETASIASEQSTDEGESDAESDIDVAGWHSIGSRLITALGSPEDDSWEADVDADAWKDVGSRIAVALHDDPDGQSVDAEGWRDVSSRIATACKASSNDECVEDPSPDVSEWSAVGIRVVQCFEDTDH